MVKQIALVDADSLLYLAGFAAQKTKYLAVFEKDGTVDQALFDSAASLKEFVAEGQYTLLERESIVEIEPVENALQIAKMKMKEMKRRFKNLEVYMKGDGKNWRDQVATLNVYKANRTAPKPAHMEAIRQYLIDQWGAVLINGKEADDHIATRAYERPAGKTIICSIDKDLDQIPGFHYNYQKDVEYQVSPEDAEDFFFQQALQGDYSDNVHGCWKCGAARAIQVVAEVRDEHGYAGDSSLHVWDSIVREYDASLALPNCPYVGRPASVVALENARLVWMQTEPNRLWTPPGVEPEYLEVTLDD
jgi:5'-3' exonuclease